MQLAVTTGYFQFSHIKETYEDVQGPRELISTFTARAEHSSIVILETKYTEQVTNEQEYSKAYLETRGQN